MSFREHLDPYFLFLKKWKKQTNENVTKQGLINYFIPVVYNFMLL